MEVLSCSDVQYVGDSNCTQRSSGAKPSDGIHEVKVTPMQIDYSQQSSREVDCPKKQLGGQPSNDTIDWKEDGLPRLNSPQCMGYNPSKRASDEGSFLKVEEIKKEGDRIESKELFPCSDVIFSRGPNFLKQADQVQVQVSDSVHKANESEASSEEAWEDEMSDDEGNDLELGSLDLQNQNGKPLEIDIANRKQEGEDGLVVDDCTDQDEAAALWVKWRGTWQAGIRCSRADWPLSTVKAKPTHERKKYVVIFFPHKGIHCWADTSRVLSIDEFPVPLAHSSHYSGLDKVKDLTLPRRFIMQKLALAMLNVSDQLHIEAVVESARQVDFWKGFATDASRCEGYSDLGRMLLKIQSITLPAYLNPDWLEHSFHSWARRCQKAQSAESIETLTKELNDSILWNKVDALWDAPIQPDLSSEWKTWKHEVLKWFAISHPLGIVGDAEQQNCDDSASVIPQISRKRPKLEVRRAETHPSRVEVDSCGSGSQANGVEADSQFFNCSSMDNATSASGSLKEEPSMGVAMPVENPGSATDGWYEIVVEAGDPSLIRTAEEAGNPVEVGSRAKPLLDVQRGSHSLYTYRRCMAFIEAKGRQCGRWANDGDVYCCVHLSPHSADKTAAKAEETPSAEFLCEGMTNLGTRCKHRPRIGSSFCKKHRFQGGQNSMGIERSLISPGNRLERTNDEKTDSFKNSRMENVSGKEIILFGEDPDAIPKNSSPTTDCEALDGSSSLLEKSEHSFASTTPVKCCSEELPSCIIWSSETNNPCQERAKRHLLYCEKHIPGFLKRARHGKSRLISKDTFTDFLRDCSLRKQKVQLHQACELLYGFMKSGLSRRNMVSKESLIEWILSETSKDLSVGDWLLQVVSREREKIGKLWGFGADKDKQFPPSVAEPVLMPEAEKNASSVRVTIKCKICMEDFNDDQALGVHWMDIHKKEAQWLFRGYACSVCFHSFTNRKVLGAHVKERHGVEFIDRCILFQCMPCGNHFVNPEQLWSHVLSLHYMDFRLPTVPQQYNLPANPIVQPKLVIGNEPSNNIVSEVQSDNQDGSHRLSCKICGLKFDLLPDLGRHHQVAHMGPNSLSHFPSKRNHFNHTKLKAGRPGRPRFKKGLGAAFRVGNAAGFGAKKQYEEANSVSSGGLQLPTHVSEPSCLDRPLDSQCSTVAEILFPDVQESKPRPSNLDILSIARTACCKISLQAALEEKFGVQPERLYLKAAKLCSELNIQVEWHLDGFVCPKGCKPAGSSHSLAPLSPLPNGFMGPSPAPLTDLMNDEEWEKVECHYIVSSRHFKGKGMRKAFVLCEDVSFGKESIPVVCVVDEHLKHSLHANTGGSMPWEHFNYVTERLLDPSIGLEAKSSQLGCACSGPTCYADKCDHVYLFDNDYEDAKDVHGKPMQGRFPYDEKGRILLEKGYFVYECNSLCRCSKSCHNRVLQNGVKVKLEVFKTENKGWAVRAGEPISCGTFVCEYMGEVLSDQEANKRGERHENNGCSYLYYMDVHDDDMSELNEGTVPYVIDATRYGNVSRFINHSCSPNLMNYQVLVESMDCQLAHIGLYASRDITIGEELTYCYSSKLLPGNGHPCCCGASNCRGRLH